MSNNVGRHSIPMTLGQLTRLILLPVLVLAHVQVHSQWQHWKFVETSETNGVPNLPAGMKNPSMAMDSQGNLYTAYFLELLSVPTDPDSPKKQTLHWVKFSKDVWKEIRVTLAQEEITNPQVAVDSEGNAYIFYLFNGLVEYAVWNEDRETFDPTRTKIQTSEYTADVFYDAAQQKTIPHITYINQSGHVMHDFQDGTSSVTVAGASTCSSLTLALDSLGKPHIFYHDTGTAKSFHYAEWNGATFSVTQQASPNEAGQYSDAVFDSVDNLHLCYYDSNLLELRYAVKSSSTGSWAAAETVDNNWENGGLNSISVDSSGRVHLSYVGFYGFNFKYATNKTGVWVTETLEGSQSQNFYKGTTIEVDAAGRLHILTFMNDKEYIHYWADSDSKVPLVDTDFDGIPDFDERELETDPYSPDTDWDGLTDGEEAILGTDPHQIDTDRDGVTDAREEKLSLDPLVHNTNEEIYTAFAIKHGFESGEPLGITTPYTSGWFYTTDMGWVYTDSGLYPWLYINQENQWLYYQNGTTAPRWFWNANTGLWERR